MHDVTEIEGEFGQATGLGFKSIEGKRVTTLCVGGILDRVIRPETTGEILKAMTFLSSNGIPYRVIGGGSNLIIRDEGVRDWVIMLGKGFRYIKPLGNGLFKVGGSTPLINLSRELSEGGFSGLEFAGGIPATFGGAIRMNAGAHGSEISSVIDSVDVITPDSKLHTFPAKDLKWEYRKVNLPEGSIVLSATISLKEGDRDKILAVRSRFLQIRKENQPITIPSCGSVFKNPSGRGSAAKVIETCGLKGYSRGGALISKKHPNWIVNPYRKATARDVLFLIDLCKKKAKSSLSVELETEVSIW
ncbi:MAG: UDP-N-acetylmuramate dehydrogenase [Candidatus Dadabacteria bacterium]|nr:MAG: UDP-N-acetylmuramate dehydrogenase [Candidatus Dadabacteria bacterium]